MKWPAGINRQNKNLMNKIVLCLLILCLLVWATEGFCALSPDFSEENTPTDSLHAPKHKRLKAAVLSLALGHFGAHRIYLNTHARVPVAYSVTLGGGLGIVPLVDFFHIVFTKDLSRYENSTRFFMWQDAKPREDIILP